MTEDPERSETGGDAEAAAGAPVYRLEHSGRGGELFLIFLVNLALTVLTLGIYRFWGKTRIRRYVWSHSSLLGEPLEYTGRGIELFLGALFALALVYGPIIGLFVWLGIESSAPDPQAGPAAARIGSLVFLILFVAMLLWAMLYYVAVFAAWRYRIGRTAWLGIRGGMEGSAWSYGFLALCLGALNVLTFGWTKPWADSVIFRYRLARTWFGNRNFGSELNVGGLYGSFALAWFGTAFVAMVSIFVVGAVFGMAGWGNPFGQTELPWQAEATKVGGYLAPLIAYQLLICGYKAALIRNIAGTLTFGSVRFACPVTFGQVFRLRVPNFLLMALTLGFAYPWVVLRTARFIARHVEFRGDPREATIEQTVVGTPAYGEGLMEFLGIGTI